MSWVAVGVIGAGTVASMISEKQKSDVANKATRQSKKDTQYYWEQAQWTPERREEMTKGIQGFISKYVNAGKERSSRTGADLGRGGGYYGGETERIRRAGLEYGAGKLAETYVPPQMPGMPNQFLSGGTGQTLDSLSQIAGIYSGYKLGQGDDDITKWPNISTIRGGQGGGYGF